MGRRDPGAFGARLNRILLQVLCLSLALPFLGAQQLPPSARLQSLRRPGYGDWASLSPDATELAISPDDAPFQILDARTGQVRRSFPQLGSQVRGSRWLPDGKRLLVFTLKQGWSLVDAQGGRVARRLPARGVSYLEAISPEGRWFAWLELNGKLRVLDLKTWKELPLPKGLAGNAHNGITALGFDGQAHLVLAQSPPMSDDRGTLTVRRLPELKLLTTVTLDTRLTALACSPRTSVIALGARSGGLVLWDWKDPKHLRDLHGPADPAVTLAWSPDARLLAFGSHREQGLVHVDSGAFLSRQVEPRRQEYESDYILGDEGQIAAFDPASGAWLEGGRRFEDWCLQRWDVAVLRAHPHPPSVELEAGPGPVVWQPRTGEWWFTSGATWKAVDAGGRPRWERPLPGNATGLEGLALSPEGDRVALVVTREGVEGSHLWMGSAQDLDHLAEHPWAPLQVPEGPEPVRRGVDRMAWDAAGHLWIQDMESIWKVAADGRSTRVPVAGPKPEGDTAFISGFAPHPTGKSLAVVLAGALELRDPDTGRVQSLFSVGEDRTPGLAWSADGQWLATAPGQLLHRGTEGRLGWFRAHSELWKADPAGPVALSPDGRVVASVLKPGRFNETTQGVGLMDARNGQWLAFLDATGVKEMVFSTDGRSLATVSQTFRMAQTAEGDFHQDVHSGLTLWDLGDLMARLPILPPPAPPAGGAALPVRGDWSWGALSPDQRTLALVGRRSGLRLWDLKTREPLSPKLGGPLPERCFFSADGESLVGVQGTSLLRWDVRRGALLSRTSIEGRLDGALASPDRRVLWGMEEGGLAALDTGSMKIREVLPLEHGDFALLAVDAAGRPVWRERASTLARHDGTSIRRRALEGVDWIERVVPWGNQGWAALWTRKAGKGPAPGRYVALMNDAFDLLEERPLEDPALLAASPDGRNLVISDARGLQVWNARPLRKLGTMDPLDSEIKALRFSDDGYTLITLGEELLRSWAWGDLVKAAKEGGPCSSP